MGILNNTGEKMLLGRQVRVDWLCGTTTAVLIALTVIESLAQRNGTFWQPLFSAALSSDAHLDCFCYRSTLVWLYVLLKRYQRKE